MNLLDEVSTILLLFVNYLVYLELVHLHIDQSFASLILNNKRLHIQLHILDVYFVCQSVVIRVVSVVVRLIIRSFVALHQAYIPDELILYIFQL